MKKLLTSTLAVFAISVAANAQGTWYTDQALWLSRTTVVDTANYNSLGGGFRTTPYTENGVTATATGGFVTSSSLPALSTNNSATTPLRFTFSGNAFGGMFAMTDANFNFFPYGMDFTVDGSLPGGVYNITSQYIYLPWLHQRFSSEYQRYCHRWSQWFCHGR